MFDTRPDSGYLLFMPATQTAIPTRTEFAALAAALPLTKNKAAQVQWVRTRRYYPDGRSFMSLPPVSTASDAEIAAAFAAEEYDKAIRTNAARLERIAA